jgi:hypothetical protein
MAYDGRIYGKKQNYGYVRVTTVFSRETVANTVEVFLPNAHLLKVYGR